MNRIVFDREELISALVVVAPAVGGGRFRPLERSVRFDVGKEDCGIAANNGAIQIAVTTACMGQNAQTFCIEHDVLLKTARLMSGDDFTLELSKVTATIVISKEQSYQVNLEVNTDFNMMEMGNKAKTFEVKAGDLARAVKAATPLISFTPDMLQYLYLSFNKDRGLLTLIGSSRLGISTQQVEAGGEADVELMVQRHFANLLGGLDGDGGVFISSDGSKAGYALGTTKVISPLPEGNYPVKIVREGIKACGDDYLLFERAEMLNALRRLNLFSSVERELKDKTTVYEPVLTFEIKQDRISFDAVDKMSGRKGSESLEVNNKKKIELTSAVKATTVIKVLTHLWGKDVRLYVRQDKTTLYFAPDVEKKERRQFWIVGLYNL